MKDIDFKNPIQAVRISHGCIEDYNTIKIYLSILKNGVYKRKLKVLIKGDAKS